jgi:hypothetical protein
MNELPINVFVISCENMVKIESPNECWNFVEILAIDRQRALIGGSDMKVSFDGEELLAREQKGGSIAVYDYPLLLPLLRWC